MPESNSNYYIAGGQYAVAPQSQPPYGGPPQSQTQAPRTTMAQYAPAPAMYRDMEMNGQVDNRSPAYYPQPGTQAPGSQYPQYQQTSGGDPGYGRGAYSRWPSTISFLMTAPFLTM